MGLALADRGGEARRLELLHEWFGAGCRRHVHDRERQRLDDVAWTDPLRLHRDRGGHHPAPVAVSKGRHVVDAVQ